MFSLKLNFAQCLNQTYKSLKYLDIRRYRNNTHNHHGEQIQYVCLSAFLTKCTHANTYTYIFSATTRRIS